MNKLQISSYTLLLIGSLAMIGCSKQPEKNTQTTSNTSVNSPEKEGVQPFNVDGTNPNINTSKEPLTIEGGGASVAKPPIKLRPRVIIPNTPGNIKNLLEKLAAKNGYIIDWRLKGYYNLDQKTLEQYNQPIGFTLPLITDLMTYANKTLKAYWPESNPGEPFPYPTDVGYFVCDKSIILFEMNNPQPNQPIQYTVGELLKKPEYKKCFIPDVLLGMNINIPTNTNSGAITINPNIELPKMVEPTQFDFSSPPPFVQGNTQGVKIDVQNMLPNGMQFSTPTNQSPVRIPVETLK